ncbi:T6SS immunity protein Tli4 family protein [Burkholderia anthina]|uniref:T6SS immunity protein Tli4 family protein n=1 Tax=Burkholderia anthina TaxID=179879 RepID=UPI00158A27CB|nr:T6SS immunity protein Tli4 family protein [Burkholderia anthina]
MTAPLMHDTRPWCIGRFVLDLPRDAEVYNEQFKYMGYSIESTRNVSTQEFAHQVDARERELRATMRLDPHKSFTATKTPWVHQVVQPSEDSRFFVFSRYDVPQEEQIYDVEGYAVSGKTLFTLKNRFGDGYDQTAIQNASEILRNIHPRGNWDIPPDSAFCFNGGVISGKALPGFDATLAVGLVPGRPSNLIVKLRESVDLDQQASLLKGLSEFESELKRYAHQYKILRKGPRQFAGMPAEELLIDISEDGVQKYQFYLLAAGVEGDYSKPHAGIQLIFGAAPDDVTPAAEATSPVSKEQAIQAWDSVLNSFHYRGPTAK